MTDVLCPPSQLREYIDDTEDYINIQVLAMPHEVCFLRLDTVISAINQSTGSGIHMSGVCWKLCLKEPLLILIFGVQAITDIMTII